MKEAVDLRAQKALIPQAIAALQEKKARCLQKYQDQVSKLEAQQETERHKEEMIDKALVSQEIKCKEYMVKINEEYKQYFTQPERVPETTDTPPLPLETMSHGSQQQPSGYVADFSL